MRYIANNLDETAALAQALASTLKGGEIILLNGDLGAGKTTFTKALAKALGITETITSPTFMFMKEYKEGSIDLYHFDMYRVENEAELTELGLNEYLFGNGVCVIEWNKFCELPKSPIVINITRISDNARAFELQNLIIEV